LAPLPAAADEAKNLYSDNVWSLGTLLEIDSEYPKEVRQALVLLPRGYESSPQQRYPVLYLLDGRGNLQHTAFTATVLASRRKMPKIIIVALPTTRANRSRDYTPASDQADSASPGGADQFLNFLERELIPRIDKDYRTQPFRMLAGHSRGGLLVAHSYLSRPHLFQAHFAFSPALGHDDKHIVTQAPALLKGPRPPREFLYMNLGGTESKAIDASFANLQAMLEAHAPAGLRWIADLAEDESHDTTPLAGQYPAFRKLFANWDVPFSKLEAGGLAAVREHHKALSTEFGYPIQPSERLLVGVGFGLLRRKRPEQAVEAFELATQLYPDSPKAHDNLAKGLEAAGRKEDAKAAVQRAIVLAKEIEHPRLEAFLDHLKRLEESEASSTGASTKGPTRP